MVYQDKAQVGSVRLLALKLTRLNVRVPACSEKGYEHAWLIVMTSEPEQANVCWYGLRTWIECGSTKEAVGNGKTVRLLILLAPNVSG